MTKKYAYLLRYFALMFFVPISSLNIFHIANASSVSNSSNVRANQCFINEQSAYQYLLHIEKQQKQQTNLNTATATININTASEAQLTQLTGIGSKKAQAIIEYRETQGKFNSVDELTKVKGIGEKTVEKNRSRLTV